MANYKSMISTETKTGGLTMPDLNIKSPYHIPIESELASSKDSNILFVLNLILRISQHHRLSRSLTTTGFHTTIITAGEGVYHVDRNLASLTKDLVILGRTSCSMVCLRNEVEN
mmetsp:Transcript_21153/g.18391  ORF Transcript_21153/g.18391 Transcript_21153/m.18391 type:complete len:114 (+) Transcript_21153:149-490(+)